MHIHVHTHIHTHTHTHTYIHTHTYTYKDIDIHVQTTHGVCVGVLCTCMSFTYFAIGLYFDISFIVTRLPLQQQNMSMCKYI